MYRFKDLINKFFPTKEIKNIKKDLKKRPVTNCGDCKHNPEQKVILTPCSYCDIYKENK